MTNVKAFKRRAKIEDYEEIYMQGTKRFKLSWQPMLYPGTVAGSPEEGVKDYNEFIDNEAELNKQKYNNEEIIKCYNWCIESALPHEQQLLKKLFLDVYYERDSFYDDENKSDEFRTHAASLFLHNQDVKFTLKPEQIRKLEKLNLIQEVK